MSTMASATTSQAQVRGNTALEKIRADLNLEKWSIWQPASSQNKKTRVLRREITNKQGDKATAEVTIGYIDRIGTLTTEDQKTCYALIKLWEEMGKPVDLTFFSLRNLARVLKKRWGTNVIESQTRSLTRLRAVPLLLHNAYYNSTTQETIGVLDTFNILADLKIITRRKNGHVTREAGYFQFNDYILANLLNNYTKPILLDPILNFKSEIAQLLYQHLDLIMADKSYYERRTRALFFDDLGLDGVAYRHLADRTRKITRALEELRGVRLTTGIITSIQLIATKDGKDAKLAVRKQRKRTLPTDEAPHGNQGEDVPPEPRSTDETITVEARKLLNYFYHLFFGTENPYPQSKALGQAVNLIAQHGRELAYSIVDFSHKAAAETHYKPQTFGGILQYTVRALDAHAMGKKAEAARSQEKRKEEEERLKDQYEVYRHHEVAHIRQTMPARELAAIEETVRVQLQEEGKTPHFMIDIIVRVNTDSVLAERCSLASFDEWKEANVPRR